MSLIKKTKDKKVNFEFNKEYIKVVTSKIANNDAQFITNSFREMHPADAADIIEHLNQNDRESLIKLNNFDIDPEVFIELNESIQAEIITYLSSDSIVTILTNLESDDAISILENVPEEDKNSILSSIFPKCMCCSFLCCGTRCLRLLLVSNIVAFDKRHGRCIIFLV